MKRAIVQPADVTGAPLDELKQWLGISRDAEDAQLAGLLRASLDLCEAFTGQVPLEASCEERLEAGTDWAHLSAGPVRAITAVDGRSRDGQAVALDPAGYEIDIGADGTGRVRNLHAAGTAAPVLVVTFVAGLAAQWASLPEALKHGVIRLAAHHYRGRGESEDSGPPASVAALWRPWKRLSAG